MYNWEMDTSKKFELANQDRAKENKNDWSKNKTVRLISKSN